MRSQRIIQWIIRGCDDQGPSCTAELQSIQRVVDQALAGDGAHDLGRAACRTGAGLNNDGNQIIHVSVQSQPFASTAASLRAGSGRPFIRPLGDEDIGFREPWLDAGTEMETVGLVQHRH